MSACAWAASNWHSAHEIQNGVQTIQTLKRIDFLDLSLSSKGHFEFAFALY